jgi:hypothetical protein
MRTSPCFAFAVAALTLAACSRPPTPTADVAPAKASGTPATAAVAASKTSAGSATTPAAGACGVPGGPTCLRFDTAADAFRHVLAANPAILAIGEAHAQKGTEAIASTTKRFTEELLPVVAPRASDIVVELWAPDPRCQKAVKAVASAQKPVVEKQAETNQNEYVTLGTRAKALGVTPWLLRPTCDDFATLADAGADSIEQMLRLVKRLTEQKLTQSWQKNRAGAGTAAGDVAGDAAAAAPKMALAYGGAMHNDLKPAADAAEFSFGPELDRRTSGGYVELDLIVREYVKDTPTWQKLPWYSAWKADEKPKDKATLFVLAPHSFVLVLPDAN